MKIKNFFLKTIISILTLTISISISIFPAIIEAYGENDIPPLLAPATEDKNGRDSIKLKSPDEFSYKGDGRKFSPYEILIYTIDGYQPPNTAPRKFWNDIMEKDKELNVLFKTTHNAKIDGNLQYSFLFQKENINPDGWDEDWSSAFRLSPVIFFNDEAGILKFTTAYKGSFSFYWNDWQLKLNLKDFSKNLSENERINPNDRLKIVYYGAFNSYQTNRGQYYVTDFYVCDNNEKVAIETKADENGFVTLEHEKMLPVGGNYVVRKLPNSYFEDEKTKDLLSDTPFVSVLEMEKLRKFSASISKLVFAVFEIF